MKSQTGLYRPFSSRKWRKNPSSLALKAGIRWSSKPTTIAHERCHGRWSLNTEFSDSLLGKIGGEFGVSFRVAPWAAWLFPSLELRAANSYTCLILDLDGWGSYERAVRTVRRTKVGALNWAVENKRTGGVHGVWTLANPVHRADMALAAPLKRYGRVSEYYAAALGADAGYTGVLTHNPMEDAQLPGFETHWLRREPYTLNELAGFVPFGWRRPKVSRTAVGRNCDVFAHCMRWAGAPENLGLPVFNEAHRINGSFKLPLDPPEVGGISRSVERYRRRWIKQGRFWGPGNCTYDHSSEAQAKRGKRSGQARRKRTKGRDQAIVQAVVSGQSMRSIAREYGLHHRAVEKIVGRDAPLFARSTPLTLTRPWEAEGVSRAQWYRRNETSGDRT